MKIPVGYLVKYTVLGICKFFRTACPIVIYLSEFLRKLIFYRIWIKIKNIALKLFFKNSQTIEQAPVLQNFMVIRNLDIMN